MSSLKGHQQDKDVGCDHVELSEADHDLQHVPGDALVEAERAQSVLANARKHWRVLLIGLPPGVPSIAECMLTATKHV